MAGRGAGGLIAIRCPHRKHLDVEPGASGRARVFCRDRRCKHGDNEVVMHIWDLATGELVETRRFSKWPQVRPDHLSAN